MPWNEFNLGLSGYGLAAVSYLLFSALLLTSWRGRLQGGLLFAACLVSAVWAGLSAIKAGYYAVPSYLLWSLESLRALFWLVFLVRLLEMQAAGTAQRKRMLGWLRRLIIAFCLLLLLPLEGIFAGFGLVLAQGMPDPRLLFHVLLVIAGLALTEQVYRNTPWEQRWGIKYLALGVGTLLVIDFYLFADALLFNRLDPDIWQARGAISVLAVPLLAVSAARNPQWSLDLFVSRRIVFHTSAIVAAGTYLLVMAMAGYYIRIYGGEWSGVLQIVFLAGAGLVLLALLFSGQFRSRIKLFISRNFYSYKYDYREEWLRLIGLLSGREALRTSLGERVIFGLSEIVDSPGGALWLRSEQGELEHRVRWNLTASLVEGEMPLGSLPSYLRDTQWVINLDEYAADSDYYEGLELPDWLFRDKQIWLIVPLVHEEELIGFVLLARPRAPQRLDWETLDLLKTAGSQAASYLVLERVANALAEARQFEGFNRLSAFVMHDLKNLIAQLSLVTKNAERHKHNPQFIDDAVLTINNSVDKMSRLMAQLRSALPERRSDKIELGRLLRQVVEERSGRPPTPRLQESANGQIEVYANADRLGAVIGHVIQNAQEATGGKGRVEVRVKVVEQEVVIEVEDDGVGMSREFVRNRLFKPFDSTKGLAGMGIGAYECREFVVSLGGRVTVESAPGKGALFSIFLPLPTGEAIEGELH